MKYMFSAKNNIFFIKNGYNLRDAFVYVIPISNRFIKERNLNKAELIAAIAEDSELSKAKAEFALNSAMDNIKKAVTKGDSVQLIGFGTFSSGKRAARVGRNPETGEAIKIAAAKTVKFTAGKAFKDAVNKRKK